MWTVRVYMNKCCCCYFMLLSSPSEKYLICNEYARTRGLRSKILVIEHKSINASCCIFVTICAHPLLPKKIKFCEQTAVKKKSRYKNKTIVWRWSCGFFFVHLWICLRVTLCTHKNLHTTVVVKKNFFFYLLLICIKYIRGEFCVCARSARI